MPFEIPDTAMLLPLLTSGLTAIITLFFGWLVAGWAQSFAAKNLERAKLDQALSRFFSSLIRYTILFATIIAAADVIGFETTSLMTIFASAGLAVGLALQGSLSNFAAGVMILFFRPFTLQDVITVGGITGQVSEIGLFATDMMRPDGTKVVVPNASITGSTLLNHTTVGVRRGTVDIGVDYGSNLDDVRAALSRAATAVPDLVKVNDGPGFVVAFVSFGGSSLDFQVHVYAAPANYLDALESARINIYNELNKADIGIPFPNIVVHQAPTS